MTPEELVMQLRDIHLPPNAEPIQTNDFALWPIVVFVVVVGSAALIRRWRRNAWRREVRAELRRIGREQDVQTRWSELQRLAKWISDHRGRRIALPVCAFRDPNSISAAEALELSAHLRTEAAK